MSLTKNETFEEECVNEHNRLRALHGCPPLTLNRTLCIFAQEWAQNLAIKNTLDHRKESEYGENIFMSTGKSIDGSTAVQNWYAEINDYNFNKAQFEYNIGHFTQVIWKDTTEIGVGVAERGDSSWVVVNYNPPGNYIGELEKHVPPPIETNVYVLKNEVEKSPPETKIEPIMDTTASEMIIRISLKNAKSKSEELKNEAVEKNVSAERNVSAEKNNVSAERVVSAEKVSPEKNESAEKNQPEIFVVPSFLAPGLQRQDNQEKSTSKVGFGLPIEQSTDASSSPVEKPILKAESQSEKNACFENACFENACAAQQAEIQRSAEKINSQIEEINVTKPNLPPQDKVGKSDDSIGKNDRLHLSETETVASVETVINQLPQSQTPKLKEVGSQTSNVTDIGSQTSILGVPPHHVHMHIVPREDDKLQQSEEKELHPENRTTEIPIPVKPTPEKISESNSHGDNTIKDVLDKSTKLILQLEESQDKNFKQINELQAEFQKLKETVRNHQKKANEPAEQNISLPHDKEIALLEKKDMALAKLQLDLLTIRLRLLRMHCLVLTNIEQPPVQPAETQQKVIKMSTSQSENNKSASVVLRIYVQNKSIN